MTPNAHATTLVRTQQAVLIAAAAGASLSGWAYLLATSSHHAGATPLTPAGLAAATAMWMAMTLAMMAPATLHWLFAYAELVNRGTPGQTTRAVTSFLTGYFAVWLGYCVLGACLQLGLAHTGYLDHTGKLPPAAAGTVLIAAGVVWFLPFRRKCLQHCRNPITHFLGHWNAGPRSGFRFGLAHGAWCVGCCWALMLTGLATGIMNLLWMALLTLIVSVEKLVPNGDRIAGAFAVGIAIYGAATLLGY